VAILLGREVRPGLVSALVRQLLAATRSLEWGGTLGQMLPLIASPYADDDAMILFTNPMLRAASQPINEIVRACRSRDLARVVQAGRALVGLGPGLTPAGDDFLGGLLFAALHLQAAYSDALRWEQQPIDDLLIWARPRTNSISHAILCDHARGDGAEPLHDLVSSLLRGQDLPMPAVRRLLDIGSTSGWDIFTGAMAGMLLIAGLDHSEQP
jgi:hypothetical protein